MTIVLIDSRSNTHGLSVHAEKNRLVVYHNGLMLAQQRILNQKKLGEPHFERNCDSDELEKLAKEALIEGLRVLRDGRGLS